MFKRCKPPIHLSTLCLTLLLQSCASTPGPRPQHLQQVDEIKDADIVQLLQEKNAEADNGLMSLAELTDCAKTVLSLKQENERLKTIDHGLADKKQAITEKNQQLDALRKQMDSHVKQQLDEFKRRLQENNAAISQFNAEVKQLRLQEVDLRSQNDAFNTHCAKRSFRQTDWQQLRPELQQAADTISAQVAKPVEKAPTEVDAPAAKTVEVPAKPSHSGSFF